jgi:membrane-associated phospholipid phosphatase
MAVLRVMAGAHFPSDVIFAGVFTFLIIWVVYAFIYRWPRTRLSDDGVEHALERMTLPIYDSIAALFSQKPK